LTFPNLCTPFSSLQNDDISCLSLDSVIGIVTKGWIVWGSDHGRGKRFFLLPHKKKPVQITNLNLVPKLRMNEATGPPLYALLVLTGTTLHLLVYFMYFNFTGWFKREQHRCDSTISCPSGTSAENSHQ